jgi:hypothetical protein
MVKIAPSEADDSKTIPLEMFSIHKNINEYGDARNGRAGL